MTTTELQSKLNTTLAQMDRKQDLFYGGCCFAAYEVAKRLEEINVPYKVVLYHNFTNRNRKLQDMCTGKNDLIKNEWYGFDHVAIAVQVNKKNLERCEIGGSYYKDLGGDHCYHRTVLDDLNSENLKWMYENGTWNDIYSHRHDTTLRRKLNLIFKQYKNEII